MMDLSEIVPKVYIDPIVVPEREKKKRKKDPAEEPASEEMINACRLNEDAAQFSKILNA